MKKTIGKIREVLNTRTIILFGLVLFLSLFVLILEITLFATGTISPDAWYSYVILSTELILLVLVCFKLVKYYNLKLHLRRRKH